MWEQAYTSERIRLGSAHDFGVDFIDSTICGANDAAELGRRFRTDAKTDMVGVSFNKMLIENHINDDFNSFCFKKCVWYKEIIYCMNRTGKTTKGKLSLLCQIADGAFIAKP